MTIILNFGGAIQTPVHTVPCVLLDKLERMISVAEDNRDLKMDEVAGCCVLPIAGNFFFFSKNTDSQDFLGHPSFFPLFHYPQMICDSKGQFFLLEKLDPI